MNTSEHTRVSGNKELISQAELSRKSKASYSTKRRTQRKKRIYGACAADIGPNSELTRSEENSPAKKVRFESNLAVFHGLTVESNSSSWPTDAERTLCDKRHRQKQSTNGQGIGDLEVPNIGHFVCGVGALLQPFRRKDSGTFAGRSKANPLRQLAALLRSKLVTHGGFRNLLELANEIHQEAKVKHNPTLRRIYDVVNVLEAAGVLERAIFLKLGKTKSVRGSALSGSLIRWCSGIPGAQGAASKITSLRNILLKKREEVIHLEEEVKLVESLLVHRKLKVSQITSAVTSTSYPPFRRTSCERIMDPSPSSAASKGIKIPFFILKASRQSNDRNFEVCTFADETETESEVIISSEYNIQPFEWRSILREMLKMKISSNGAQKISHHPLADLQLQNLT